MLVRADISSLECGRGLMELGSKLRTRVLKLRRFRRHSYITIAVHTSFETLRLKSTKAVYKLRHLGSIPFLVLQERCLGNVPSVVPSALALRGALRYFERDEYLNLRSAVHVLITIGDDRFIRACIPFGEKANKTYYLPL